MTMRDLDARVATRDDDPAKVERAQAVADVSDGMLAVAAGKIAAANDAAMQTVKPDLLVDPMPAEHCDIIFSAMTLYHVPDTDAILRHFDAASRDERTPVHRRLRRYPVLLMVARKASGGARGGSWQSSND